MTSVIVCSGCFNPTTFFIRFIFASSRRISEIRSLAHCYKIMQDRVQEGGSDFRGFYTKGSGVHVLVVSYAESRSRDFERLVVAYSRL
jgi:hypothetical protein